MISKLNNKPFDESDETLFEVQLTYLCYNVDPNRSNPFSIACYHSMTEKCNNLQSFFFVHKTTKKLERCGSKEKGKEISSIPNLPIYVQFYVCNHNAKVF